MAYRFAIGGEQVDDTSATQQREQSFTQAHSSTSPEWI